MFEGLSTREVIGISLSASLFVLVFGYMFFMAVESIFKRF